MKIEAIDGALCRFLGVIVITAALAGCGADASNSSAASQAGSANTSTSVSSDSSSGLIALSSSDYTAAPSSNAVVTIYRVGSAQGSASVSYTTVDGSAVAGTDYVATAGSVTWQDGDSNAKTVAVPVTQQASGKNFNFALTGVAGQATFGSPAVALIGVSASSSASSGSSSSSGAGSSSSSAASTTVTLSWMAPTQNTNGTALTNLAGFDIYYGTSASAMTQKISLNTVAVLSYVVGDLSSGTWYFQVVAVNSLGTQSSPSSTVSVTI
jgi:hypothetical protein